MRSLVACAASVFLLSACGGGGGGSSNIEGGQGETPQKFDSLALFDPVPVNTNDSATIPFPFDGLFAGFNDPTLNIPNASNVPFVAAANQQDGFSTTASAFIDVLGFVDLSEISSNLVIINSANGSVLQPGVDYTLQPSPARDAAGVAISAQRTRVLIEPLRPLSPATRYLVALKRGAKNRSGGDIIPSAQFRITRSGTPVTQQSEPILAEYSDAQKARLEALRSQVIRPVVEALSNFGIAEEDVMLAYSFTTSSATLSLNRLAAVATPRFAQVVNTGRNTSIIGAPGIADIYSGVMQVPYYLENSGGNTRSTAPVTGFWAADTTRPDVAARFLGQVPCGAFATGATLPDGQTARPSASTTVCYPLPVQKSVETIPLLATVPNANSGQTKPANGWPVVIFQHGITRNRGDALPIAPALAQAGFVVLAIDLPLHGITPTNTFAALRQDGRERTFDLDLVNNSTGAPGPDGVVDTSGASFLNLASLLTARDNLRQSVADLQNLTATVGRIDLDNDGSPDLDASKIRFVGHSLGGTVGTTFLGTNTTVGAATLAMAGGGIAKLLDASKAFGPVVSGGLRASGLNEGTDAYESYLRFAQTLLDSADPINFATAARSNHPIHLIKVINDLTLPNDGLANDGSGAKDQVLISGFLSGTDPLIAQMGLEVVGPLSAPLASRNLRTGANLGIASVFATGNHGSILDPSGSTTNAATTQEMQRQTANFLASNGTCLPTGGSCSAP